VSLRVTRVGNALICPCGTQGTYMLTYDYVIFSKAECPNSLSLSTETAHSRLHPYLQLNLAHTYLEIGVVAANFGACRRASCASPCCLFSPYPSRIYFPRPTSRLPHPLLSTTGSSSAPPGSMRRSWRRYSRESRGG
jgi:hypothetical protein